MTQQTTLHVATFYNQSSAGTKELSVVLVARDDKEVFDYIDQSSKRSDMKLWSELSKRGWVDGKLSSDKTPNGITNVEPIEVFLARQGIQLIDGDKDPALREQIIERYRAISDAKLMRA